MDRTGSVPAAIYSLVRERRRLIDERAAMVMVRNQNAVVSQKLKYEAESLVLASAVLVMESREELETIKRERKSRADADGRMDPCRCVPRSIWMANGS
jgi:hypothetical protein